VGFLAHFVKEILEFKKSSRKEYAGITRSSLDRIYEKALPTMEEKQK